MRARIQNAIPSMFHRRLVLQLALFLAALGVLSGRLGTLTLVEGGERLEKAESRLVRRTWTPTVRGRILDRKGRVLAMDRPSYSAAVEFGVLTGDWARAEAERTARRVHGEGYDLADGAQRAALVGPILDKYEAHVGRMYDRLAEMTPPGHEAVVHVTLTDDHPWAEAFVLIEARPVAGGGGAA